jgi:hypothetical protein
MKNSDLSSLIFSLFFIIQDLISLTQASIEDKVSEANVYRKIIEQPYGLEKGYRASIWSGERLLSLHKVWRKAI